MSPLLLEGMEGLHVGEIFAVIRLFLERHSKAHPTSTAATTVRVAEVRVAAISRRRQALFTGFSKEHSQVWIEIRNLSVWNKQMRRK